MHERFRVRRKGVITSVQEVFRWRLPLLGQLARLQIPEKNRALLVGRHQPAVVVGERELMNFPVLAGQGATLFAAFRFLNSEGAVLQATGDQRTIPRNDVIPDE